MKIVDVKAYPTSYRVPKELQVSLGIGTMTKRDCVMVKVTTEDGIVGWGESHHARSPGSIGHLINTTLKGFVVGMDATDTVGIWAKIYKFQLGSHGMGAATAMAMSGLDQALWDIKGKAVGWPLYKLLGGSNRPVPAYAGGISLGYQAPESLADEAGPMVAAGYKALKLRVGDSVKNDIARMTAVRKRFGDDMVLLTDANTGYTVEDVRRVMPAMDELGIAWLEEPFPAHDHRSYAMAKGWGVTPLAAGENHYTRFEFPPHHRGRQHHHPAARPVQERRHHRGAAHRGGGVDVEAADPSAQFDDRPEPRRVDPLPGVDRQWRLLRGRSLPWPTSSATSWAARRGRSARTATSARSTSPASVSRSTRSS